MFDPAEVAGLSPKEILTKVGWTEKQITKSAGKKVTLSFFEVDTKNFVVEVPTWDSVKKMAKSDPDIRNILAKNGLKGKFAEVFDGLKTKGLKGNLNEDEIILRDFLNGEYSINELFSGKGYTETLQNKFGIREWWIRSKNGSQINEINWNHQPFNSINIHNIGAL